MTEYISREAVINITAETGAWETQNRIRELPAADVQPIRLKIIIFFAITALAGYVLGYTIGHWTTSQEVEAARKEMDIDEEDMYDELFK